MCNPLNATKVAQHVTLFNRFVYIDALQKEHILMKHLSIVVLHFLF